MSRMREYLVRSERTIVIEKYRTVRASSETAALDEARRICSEGDLLDGELAESRIRTTLASQGDIDKLLRTKPSETKRGEP